MYHSAAAVCADLAGAGVAVVECPLKENACMCLADGALVAMDSARFESQQEQATALIHEAGHFLSGAFYTPLQPVSGQGAGGVQGRQSGNAAIHPAL